MSSIIHHLPAMFVIFFTTVLAQSYHLNDMEKKPASSSHKKAPAEGQCGCMHGPSGAPGIPGVPGYHGLRGEDGAKGQKGDSGDNGLDGRPGLTGLRGPVGPEGMRGKRGDKGIPGLSGVPGPIGIKGAQGYDGLPGLKGSKGDPQTLPKKVAFSVARSQKLGPVLLDTTITFDNIFANIGNSFDEFSSHFICKVNGTYIFTSHVLGQLNKDVYAWIMLNNKHKVPLHGDKRAGYGTGSQTIILNLRYDDHVWIQLDKGSGVLNDYTTFTGYLLYEDDNVVSTDSEDISNHLETNYNDYWRWRK